MPKQCAKHRRGQQPGQPPQAARGFSHQAPSQGAQQPFSVQHPFPAGQPQHQRTEILPLRERLLIGPFPVRQRQGVQGIHERPVQAFPAGGRRQAQPQRRRKQKRPPHGVKDRASCPI